MNTREHFKKQGLELDWGKSKVVIEVGRERDRIVCSPKAFRYLKRAIAALNDFGYVDPVLEGEMIDDAARTHSNSKKGRREGPVRAAQEEIDAANLNWRIAWFGTGETASAPLLEGQYTERPEYSPGNYWPNYDEDGDLIGSKD